MCLGFNRFYTAFNKAYIELSFITRVLGWSNEMTYAHKTIQFKTHSGMCQLPFLIFAGLLFSFLLAGYLTWHQCWRIRSNLDGSYTSTLRHNHIVQTSCNFTLSVLCLLKRIIAFDLIRCLLMASTLEPSIFRQLGVLWQWLLKTQCSLEVAWERT